MPGKTAGSSSTVPRAQHPSQAQGASESKIPPQQLLPTKKPKPAGKGAANISMKANKAYEKWAYDEAGGSGNARPTQNLRGGGHGNENLYHY